MKNTTWIFLTAAAAIMVILVVAIPDWQTHPHGVELGAPGTSMVQFDNKSPWDALLRQGGGNQNAISANAAFIAAHPRWSSDSAMKSVTQSMIAMTEHLNKAWGSHVGATGVTCYSCHRGEDVPPETWFSHPALVTPSMFGRSENWNENADTVRKFFPDNSWALYFLHDEPIRAQSSTALRGDTVASEIEVKRVYELMMQMSDGIGVNCGYCHNSRAFADWKQSTPNRWTAFYAIRMVRDINTNYLLQVGRTLGQTKEATKVNTLAVRPEDRGPQPVNGFVVCATCHYGHTKPDQGLPTVFPLAKLDKAAAVAPAAAPY